MSNSIENANGKSVTREHSDLDPQSCTPRVRAGLIASALPFMQRYNGQTVVVKYGGSAMENSDIAKSLACDIALLNQAGANPVVVHGGGPQINSMLNQLGIEAQFADGLRITDRRTIEVVEMVLAGSVNKEIVSVINSEGERAIGISGKDANLVLAEPIGPIEADRTTCKKKRIVDLGFVGKPVRIDRKILDVLSAARIIPVISTVATGVDGNTYNINADTFAGAVAGALNARRLLFLTDVPGVLDEAGRVIERLTVSQAQSMIADGSISKGMIPKVETCIDAINSGVEGVVILDGKAAHSVVLELFTDTGVGTLISSDECADHDIRAVGEDRKLMMYSDTGDLHSEVGV